MFMLSNLCLWYCAMLNPRSLPLYNFPPGISLSIEAICDNLRQTLLVKPGLFFFLFNCIHKKLCTIWCLWYKFDLWSNKCLYLSICTVLGRNNSPRSWTARVCDSNRVSLASFPVLFGEEIVGREADKVRSSQDWFLFNWAENISTIDLAVEVDFSISLLRRRSRFSVVNEPYPQMSRRCSPASSFQTGWILWSFTFNCTSSLLSPSPSCILSPLPSSLTSKSSSSELHPSRLDSTKFHSWELDFHRKSSCSSQKSSSSLCLLKNLLLRWWAKWLLAFLA